MMDRCPYHWRGAHRLVALVPDTPDLPAVLFCDRCGMTKPVSLHQLPPADDAIAEAERIVREGKA